MKNNARACGIVVDVGAHYRMINTSHNAIEDTTMIDINDMPPCYRASFLRRERARMHAIANLAHDWTRRALNSRNPQHRREWANYARALIERSREYRTHYFA